ncbi:MAG: DUF4363 family protein [Clostridia bacterium]|nr:DUF4363 family protein [Clostridia bacterium]
MKRLIAATVLFILVITAYFTAYISIKNACEQANILLEDCVSAYDKNGNGKQEAEKLEKLWSEKENLLSFFANHQSIDDIELAIYTLLDYSDTNENEIFYEYSGTVKTLLHQLMEDTRPGIHSIF